LGSTQLVTDDSGVAVQQVEYAPFGEVVNEYNIDWSSGQVPDFKFNGKELDEESGMYYFEARYQSPPVFISRDVMFEARPYMSPYAFCSNSPVNRVDPSGMLDDEWEFDENGKCLNKDMKPKENKEKDIIRIKKADGSSVEKTYEYGTIKQKFTASVKQTDGQSVTVPFLEITDDDKAKSAFEFVADNTNVECSLTSVGNQTGANGKSFLSSSQEREHEHSAGFIYNGNWTIRQHVHNHPSKNPYPSMADCLFSWELEMKYGPTPTKVYAKGKYQSYSSYDYLIDPGGRKWEQLKKDVTKILLTR
jgi:RHS repeat-associated protein